MLAQTPRTPRRRAIFAIFVTVVFAVVTWVALLAPLLTRLSTPQLAVGQVAGEDVLAARDISYTSEVLTRRNRELAASSVQPVYTSPDTSVARRQVEKLRALLTYISSVRADPYASRSQKLADLATVEGVSLPLDTQDAILDLTDAHWAAVQQETIVVLEQVMRNVIRTDRVEEMRARVPSWVSLALPEGQARIVADLATVFVTPNSLYSEALTAAARQQALDAVTPVTRAYVAGQQVISRGQVLDEIDLEALRHLGVGQPLLRWNEPVSAALLVLLTLAYFALWLQRRGRRGSLRLEARRMAVIVSLFLAFLMSARLSISGHELIAHAFPLAGYALVVAAFFGAEVALITCLPLGVMAAYGLPNSFELTLFYLLGSIFGVLALGGARRTITLLWAGGAVALAGLAVVGIFRLAGTEVDWGSLLNLGAVILFNGLAAASLAFLLQMALAHLVGMTTAMQLVDLMRSEHPLLQTLLREAPGTYQHSLQVANLAEQAAERIGADALLTRAGALFHDVGKTLNPLFFIENQVPGFQNPHDELSPAASSAIIVRHVTDGLALARKHHLPGPVIDFMAEHHGTMLTRYQYVRAVAEAGGDETQVSKDDFRYPGPRPQSRETAILMLADSCEARVRAEVPREEEDLRRIIKSVIEGRMASDQLDKTDLTLHDLDQIYESFVATLRGMYHARIPYPTLDQAAVSSEPTVPIPFPRLRPSEAYPAPSSTPDEGTP